MKDSYDHHEMQQLFSPAIPKFPKETLDTIVIKEGEPFSLTCNPPEGVGPRQIYWMTAGKPSCNCLSLQFIDFLILY